MKYLFILGFLCLLLTASAQSTYTFSGVVSDSLNTPLIAATTVIVNPVDSSMVTFGITDNKGNFMLSNVPSGTFSLQITYIGYGTFQQSLTAAGDRELIELGQIKLSDDNTLLEEIVVKAEHVPIVIKGDTIEYNTAAYNVRKSDAVEDLLKKLPGVEVEMDGSIKVQGEEVNRVLVDGKEFFGDDPKIATRNLPAEIVEKVAVYDKKSDEAEFTGFDDGKDSKTINLKLKKDRKNGLFGRVGAGFGDQGRYTGNANLNRFSGNAQMTFLGNINNTNEVAYSLGRGFSIGGLRRASSGTSSSNGSFGKSNTGENTTGSSGINFNYDFGSKVKWRSSYFFNYADQVLQEESLSEYLLRNSSYLNTIMNTNENNQVGHNLRTSVEYDIDSTTELRLKSSLALADEAFSIKSNARNTLSSDAFISSSSQDNNSSADKFSGNFNAVLRKRFAKKGRLMKYELTANNANNDDIYQIRSSFNNAFSNLLLNQSQIEDEGSTTWSAGVSFTEPLANNQLLTLNTNFKLNNHDQVKSFFDVDTLTNSKSFNDLLSNSFIKSYDEYTFGGGYRYIGKKININAGLAYYTSYLKGSETSAEVTNRKFQYLLPALDIEWEPGDSRINFGYNKTIQEPSLVLLQPVVNNRNPLYIYNGNSDLDPIINHRFNLSFNNYDQFNFRSIFAYLVVMYSEDYITTSRTIGEDLVTYSKPVNVDNNLFATSNISYGSPINWLKAKMRLSVMGDLNNSILLLNDTEEHNLRKTIGTTLRLENKIKNHFDISLEGGYNFTRSTFDLSEQFNSSFTTKTLGADLEVYFTDRISFKTNYTLNQYSQEQFSTDDRIEIWNASINKSFGESERISIELKVNDILNTNAGILRVAGTGVNTETRSSNLGRYMLIKLNYSISSFRPKSIFSFTG